jgi:hypothetical protein
MNNASQSIGDSEALALQSALRGPDPGVAAPEVAVGQDLKVNWTPTSFDLADAIGFYTYGDFPGIESIIFNQPSSLAGFDIESTTTLSSISFPNLVNVDPLNTQGGYLRFSPTAGPLVVSALVLTTIGGGLFADQSNGLTLDFPSLVTTSALSFARAVDLTVNLPALTTIGGNGLFINSDGLTVNFPSLTTVAALINNNTPNVTIDLPALTTVTGVVNSMGCANTSLIFPSLVTVGGNFLASSSSYIALNLSSWLPTDGTTIDFRNSNLVAAMVNQILSRCVANTAFVSGTIQLDSGSNASPSGQGITDKATLIARGVSVTTN